ncbi:hypothetical protein FA95DRAFT_1614282, partial [Auriscalpium vulgare]
MNVDPDDLSPIVDTALEPTIAPFPAHGSAATGPSAPSVPTTEEVERLPNTGSRYYTLHPTLNIPVHSHDCPECTAFISHQDPSHPSWAHVQDQFRTHQRAQFDSGVSRGLAFASERIATAEDVRRRAEENVARLTRQRNIARQSEAATLEKMAELQSQLDTIRLEHTALVRDHAHTSDSLDRALAHARARSPSGELSPAESHRRRSPRPDAKKRKRSPRRPSSDVSHRRATTTETHRSVSRTPSMTPSRDGTTDLYDLRGAQWDDWVPSTYGDIAAIFSRAVGDPHASARVRALALSASDLATADRTPVMRYLIQQWGTRRNSLITPIAAAPPPPATNGGGPVSGQHAPLYPDQTRTARTSTPTDQTRTARTSAPSSAHANTPSEWTTVSHTRTPHAPANPSRASAHSSRTPASSTATSTRNSAPTTASSRGTAPAKRRAPSYSSPIEEWIEYIREKSSRCPQGVPLHPDNSILRGGPVRRLLERHLEIRRNGPEG